jgi:hypothetical protein
MQTDPHTAAPDLPDPPPEKLQFSLKQLLAFMFVSALLATAARYLVQLFGKLPDTQIAGYLNLLVLSLLLGAALYFLFRGPFLALHALRISHRWRNVRGHRRELERWSKQRLQQRDESAGGGR